jgi:hypothetical protein
MDANGWQTGSPAHDLLRLRRSEEDALPESRGLSVDGLGGRSHRNPETQQPAAEAKHVKILVRVEPAAPQKDSPKADVSDSSISTNQCLSWAYMKKANQASKENRAFRRSVRKFFVSCMKRQNGSGWAEIQTIIEMLREIEDSIEIIAREIARQIKSGK